MKESKQGVNEIVQSMKYYLELIGELSDIIEVLKENFGQFKT